MAKRTTAFVNLSISLDRKSSVALHRQLYDELRKSILTGTLKARTRLPSTRDFAGEMGVSRNTVLNAFTQLLAEGYVEGRIGSGTYVSQMLPNEMLEVRGNGRASGPILPARRPLSRRGEVISKTVISVAVATGPPRPFRSGVPSLDAFPIKTWYKLTARHWRDSPQVDEVWTTGGISSVREAIAAISARCARCINTESHYGFGFATGP
jgi:GntR family transcriptional regulator/MocR family aminotransferase